MSTHGQQVDDAPPRLRGGRTVRVAGRVPTPASPPVLGAVGAGEGAAGPPGLGDDTFSIGLRGAGGVVLVRGDLDEDAASLVRSLVDARAARGHREIWVDLRDVTFADVRGLHGLREAHDHHAAQGRHVRVLGANRMVHLVLGLWGVPSMCARSCATCHPSPD